MPLLAKRVPENSYKIMSVVHEKVFEYLCAADIGIIFRESSVINWVSRPVKAMEYEAAGLSIAHNNTVAWIVARYGINRARSVFQKALV